MADESTWTRRRFLRTSATSPVNAIPALPLISGLVSHNCAQAQTAVKGLRPPIPVIFDTDIGTDIDDTWALAQLLRCPELDTKLVLAASGDMGFRSTITARFLTEAGRADIPIGKGIQKTTNPNLRNQEPWIKGYDVSKYKGEIVEDGVGRMIRIIEPDYQPASAILRLAHLMS